MGASDQRPAGTRIGLVKLRAIVPRSRFEIGHNKPKYAVRFQNAMSFPQCAPKVGIAQMLEHVTGIYARCGAIGNRQACNNVANPQIARESALVDS
jgi:hypothetical protein